MTVSPPLSGMEGGAEHTPITRGRPFKFKRCGIPATKTAVSWGRIWKVNFLDILSAC